MQWTPQIGDPTVIAWMCVFLYLLAAIFSGLAGVKRNERERSYWVGLALCCALLAVNKQLDVHSAFLELLDLGWKGEPPSSHLNGLIVLALYLSAGTYGMFLMIQGLRNLSEQMLISLAAFLLLLLMLVGRNTLPVLSRLFGWHLITEEQTLLHIHLSEVLEICFAGIIVYAARSSAPRVAPVNN